MLTIHQRARSLGFTLIELMVGVAVLAILAMVALPSVQSMMRSNQVRNAASAILNGAQQARAEAIARNENVEFALGAGATWTIKLAAAGTTIASKATVDDAKEVVSAALPAGATKVTFNSFGSVAPNSDGTATLLSVSTDVAGAHALNVMLEGGKVRMCNPRITDSTNPRAC